MILEGHSSEAGSEETYVAQSPPLDFPFQVDTWLDVFRDYHPTVRRVYAHWKGEIEVVWAINESGALQCVGRNRWHRVRKNVEHRYPARTGVATLWLGADVKDIAEASHLAPRLLRGEAGTVVLLNAQGVIRAWEKNSDAVFVAARHSPVAPTLTQRPDDHTDF